jgi:Rod binding domain-containing protein
MTSLPAVSPTASPSPARDIHGARLKNAARQFEALFMTEMLRHTRPANQATGRFAPGKSEETWRVLMDQALGQAAATSGPAGDGQLRRAIEKSLRDADARSRKEPIR